jgi:UDP-N-acetylmuramyl pentapeptide synthase
VATGSFATALPAVAPESLLRVEDPTEVLDRLLPRLAGHDVVLLKASRGVALERLIPGFEAALGGGVA